MPGRRRKLDEHAIEALREAKRLTNRMRKTEAEAIAAWRTAAAAGASSRDIADATGIPSRTVARAVSAGADPPDAES